MFTGFEDRLTTALSILLMGKLKPTSLVHFDLYCLGDISFLWHCSGSGEVLREDSYKVSHGLLYSPLLWEISFQKHKRGPPSSFSLREGSHLPIKDGAFDLLSTPFQTRLTAQESFQMHAHFLQYIHVCLMILGSPGSERKVLIPTITQVSG